MTWDDGLNAVMPEGSIGATPLCRGRASSCSGAGQWRGSILPRK